MNPLDHLDVSEAVEWQMSRQATTFCVVDAFMTASAALICAAASLMGLSAAFIALGFLFTRIALRESRRADALLERACAAELLEHGPIEPARAA